MPPIVLGLAGCALLLTLLLLAFLWRLRLRLTALQQRCEAAPTLASASPWPVISIKILNPFELAVSASRLAGPIAGLTPHIIERIVYKRTIETLSAQLRERGVEAQVQIHHGPHHETDHVD